MNITIPWYLPDCSLTTWRYRCFVYLNPLAYWNYKHEKE